MIEFDEQQKKMVLKLVYYGPAMSGKTTNLLTLHEQLSLEGRGDLMLLDTAEDRTIYFDLLPFFYVSPTRSNPWKGRERRLSYGCRMENNQISINVQPVPSPRRHAGPEGECVRRLDKEAA